MSEIESLRAEVAGLRAEQNFLLMSILAAVQQGVRVASSQRDNHYSGAMDRPFTVAAPSGASPIVTFAEALNREHSARLTPSIAPVPQDYRETLPVVGDVGSLHQAVKNNPSPGVSFPGAN